MKNYLKFSSIVEITGGDLDENNISDIINNAELKIIQISTYLEMDKLSLINEIFKQRPDLTFRVYWFLKEDFSCDLSFLSKLDAVKRLSVDSLHRVSNLEVIQELSLENLKLDVLKLKDYSIIKNLKVDLKSLAISNSATGKVDFDCKWLLKYKNLRELYLARFRH